MRSVRGWQPAKSAAMLITYTGVSGPRCFTAPSSPARPRVRDAPRVPFRTITGAISFVKTSTNGIVKDPAHKSRALGARLDAEPATRLDPGRQRRVDPLLELLLRHVADDPLDQLSAPEDPERRDAHDAVPGGDGAVLVDVDLRDLEPPLVLLGELLDDRGDHPARTAPRRPEVHQHRGRRLEHLRVERLLRHSLRLRCHCLVSSPSSISE